VKVKGPDDLGSGMDDYFMVVVLQPLRWRYVECVVHHEWDMREKQ